MKKNPINAWLVDDGCDRGVWANHADQLEELNDGNLRSFTPLELLASFEYGREPADETFLHIAATCLKLTMVPIMDAMARMAGQRVDWNDVDGHAAILDLFKHWSGDGWIDSEDAPNEAQLLEDIETDLLNIVGSLGFIEDSSADVGMLWLYLPIGRPRHVRSVAELNA